MLLGSGGDRHEPNAKVFETFYPETHLQTIFVANSETEKLVDALTAGPLAAKMELPVLLVSQKSLHSSQKKVLISKQAKYIHQLGGGINPSIVYEVVQLTN
ncbi:cell wall-binding repeat-containing protein [Bacillus marinisedimentorum]|uniref:cell wall-binding repeat-containing protein n=1 Tax=Bacillus marinisedimentorum TaxID=1821260 RepID=UPI0009F34BC7